MNLNVQGARSFLINPAANPIDAITDIHFSAASTLAQHKGPIRLPGLRRMTQNVASQLKRHRGTLELKGLSGLDRGSARHLAEHKDHLDLSGILHLDNEIADALSDYDGWLVLDGLEEIDEGVARKLSNHAGSLSLMGLRQVHDDALTALKRHKGHLFLPDDLACIVEKCTDAEVPPRNRIYPESHDNEAPKRIEPSTAKWPSRGAMHTLLQPLKYNIPLYTDYISDIQRYQANLLSYSSTLADNIERKVEFENCILSMSHIEKFNISSWEIVISLLLSQSVEHSNNETHHHIRDRWLEVSKRFEAPFMSYRALSKTYQQTDHARRSFSCPTFDALYLEITRDNIVTDTELSFLQEKAKSYGVNKELLEKALMENNPALHTFNNFILEVCRDGIVTENEMRFIEEKASTYNISEELVNCILDEELKISRNFIKFRHSDQLYELVTQCFILDFISRNDIRVGKLIKYIDNNLIQNGEFENDAIQCQIDSSKQLMIDLLETRLGHKIPSELCCLSTREWVGAFGFKNITLGQATSDHAYETEQGNWQQATIDNAMSGDDNKDDSDFHIKFNGFDYYFINSEATRSLFTYQVSGVKIFVSISSSHPLYSEKDRLSLSRMIMTIIAAKMMDDRIAIDDFFDTLHYIQTRYAREMSI